MNGVHANLRAKLAEECESEGYDRMTRKDQLPIDKALALLARERISGEPAPEGAQRVLDLWRDTLGDTADHGAGGDDQRAGRPDSLRPRSRKLLAALDLAEAEVDAEPDDNSEDGDDGGEQSGQQDNSQDGEGKIRKRTGVHARRPARGNGGRGRRRRRRQIRGRRRRRRGRRPSRRPAAAPRHAPTGQRGNLPRLHTPASTRKSTPRICATPRNWRGCASNSISSCSICRA